MNTPIFDFVNRYTKSGTLRLHMPGHKGASTLGFESGDITEIFGAGNLYEENGIISESEKNAGALFGANTFYSTEGSSLCIRAMLFLVSLYAAHTGKKRLILAGRNAHKAFLSSAALLDFNIQWLLPDEGESYLSCRIDPAKAEKAIAKESPAALYLTSPDYLGSRAELGRFSEICRKKNVLLLVDNAHGAYLHFLPQPCHPMDLGVDICCDSAHKTLSVLTGGAYLHLSPRLPEYFAANAKRALALFGSTSPSYLILQSLDLENRALCGSFRHDLAVFIKETDHLRQKLRAQGYTLVESEPLKLTVQTKSYGYRGEEFAALLRGHLIECEFADPDFVVLMLTPQIGKKGLDRLENVLCSLPQRPKQTELPPRLSVPEQVLPPKKALLSALETIPIEQSLGRILADATVSCPPAVPIAVCGERINEACLSAFIYYGIRTCNAVKE